MTTSGSFRFVSLAMLVTFSAMSSGCYKNVAIRPSQITLLSDMPGGAVIGQSGNTAVVAIPVATVLTPDGTTVQIQGAYDLVLHLNSGQEYVFNHPVRSNINLDGWLDITASNRPSTQLNVDDVRQAFVTQPDPTRTFLVVFGIGLLVMAISFGVGAAIYVLSTN